MTPEQYSDNIKQCILELEQQVPVFVLSFGQYLVSTIKERITTKGEGAKGKFPKYTPKYDAYKEKKGKNQGFRDLNFTGSLMGNFKTYKVGKNYEIGFSNDKKQLIAEGNSFGNGKWSGVGYNIIEPSEKEIDIQIDVFQEQILNLLKKYLV